MDLENIKALIAHLESSKLKKMIYKKGDFELHLEKESEATPPIHYSIPPHHSTKPHFEPHHELSHAKADRFAEAPGTYVTSPMVGTYYASPAPDKPSFVKVGDAVTEHTVVCIIEAMKVMNEVKAGVSGIVAEVLADTSQPVEFGTRLLRIT